MKNIQYIAVATAALITSQLHAGTEPFFTPLTASAPVTAPNSIEELTAPWQTPENNIAQFRIVSLREVEDTVLGAGESISRVPGLGTGASMFDMIAYDPTGSFLFIPHETLNGAGVSRHTIKTGKTEVLFAGDQKGDRSSGTGWENDYGAFDPCRYTPNDTLFLAEEWSGEGRVIEVLNPYVDLSSESANIRELHSIANVSHEGINFSEAEDNVIYYVDEDHSGSIYKFVMTTPGDYTAGQTFVLSVDAYQNDANADPTINWNAGTNAASTRTGVATWIPLTNINGNYTTPTDPFLNGGNARNGRIAANEVKATPYGRPEDAEVGVLANGNEVFYFCATSEATIYSVEITGATTAIVREFASESGTAKNVGFAGTTGVINAPDNLAQDALGNIYIIEDAPNGSATGGDIWFCRDTNGDGVAESVDHFLSIQVDGSEATGMIFNPVNPVEFVVAVQHPDSTDLTNVTDGLGDSVWMFDISQINNQLFVQFLDYAHQFPSHKNDLANYFNMINQ